MKAPGRPMEPLITTGVSYGTPEALRAPWGILEPLEVSHFCHS